MKAPEIDEAMSQSPQIGSWFQSEAADEERLNFSLNPLRSGLGFNGVNIAAIDTQEIASQSPQIGSWFQYNAEGRISVLFFKSQSPQIGSWFQ